MISPVTTKVRSLARPLATKVALEEGRGLHAPIETVGVGSSDPATTTTPPRIGSRPVMPVVGTPERGPGELRWREAVDGTAKVTP